MKDITNIDYEPGDHVAVFPKNESSIVDRIIWRLQGANDPNQAIKIMMKSPSG